MDPLSVAGIVASSLGLALQLSTAARNLSDVAGKYRNAKLTVKALAQNLDILQITWTQIGQWFARYAEDGNVCDNDLAKRVKDFLETGTLVIETFEQDLRAYDVKDLKFMRRSKLIWKDNTLKDHQIRIRDQTLFMSLFLQAVKLPTPQARTESLQRLDDQFRKSNESAHSIDSIISPQPSISTSQRYSVKNSSQGSLEYRPFRFENILFMSKVYMRNSKNMMIEKIFTVKNKPKGKMRDTMQPIRNWEVIQNELPAESLLLSNEDVSTEDDETGYLLRPDKSPTPFFEQLLLGIANYINREIAPWDIQTLTPVKLAAFYRLVGGDHDAFFLNTPRASLSFVYQTLGCFYTLQPEEDPYSQPSLPALTPAGFVRWQIIQLLLAPECHVPFLQQAVKRFNLTNPVDGTRFSSVLRSTSLPCQPDMEMVEWHKSVLEKLMLEAGIPSDRDVSEPLEIGSLNL